MARFEKCESQIANRLASLDNLPEKDVKGKLDVLCEIVVLEGKAIAELKCEVDELKPKPSLLVESVKR